MLGLSRRKREVGKRLLLREMREIMQPLDEKITLDRKSFEALVSESRASILKSLAERRKTLTELSAQFRLSPSTVKEHMQVLEKAGLAVMKDEGRKWKYYELTRKGMSIVQPRELKIWIVLGLTAVAVAGAFFNFISKLPAQAGEATQPLIKAAAENGAVEAGVPAAGGGARMLTAAAPNVPAVLPQPCASLAQPVGELVLLVLAAMAFGLAAGYLIKKRM